MENHADCQTYTMTQEDELPLPVGQKIAPLKREPMPATATAAEIDRAMSMLSQITSSSDPAGEVANHLDQIDRLVPALLEINIRQARDDGRLDLAVALQEMKEEIEQKRALNTGGLTAKDGRGKATGRTVSLLLPAAHRTRRMAVIEAALKRSGWTATSPREPTVAAARPADLVIACNPHLDKAILKQMALASAQAIPVVMDLGEDFEHLPVHHPDYERIGLGTHANARAFSSAMILADHITVPSEGLANALGSPEATVSIIPDGWDCQNPLWAKGFPRRDTLNIGWMGNPGQIEDLFSIRRIIIRVLREFTETQLVIVGNSQAFQMFETIPQNRKIFLPSVAPEEYPYIFSQIDLLLVPLGSQPYYLAQSDQVLVEAGARRIPWIASPLPAVTAWKAGGATATSPEEWHAYMRQLILDENLRNWMGETGRQQAITREAGQVMIQWQALLNHLVMEG